MHRHGRSTPPQRLAQRKPQRPRLLAAAIALRFRLPAGLSSLEHPEAAPSSDLDERPAPAAVQSVAVEHQRLHPHHVQPLSLDRGGGEEGGAGNKTAGK